MSILIEGMKMPIGTRKAEFGMDADGHLICVVEPDVYYPDDDQSPMIYDVVEIPTPHGNLIDSGVILGNLKRSVDLTYNKRTSVSWSDAFESFIDRIEEQDVIIEAEEISRE